ncbi:MAG: hypothetical protein IT323_20115 [Anaerolineae bacterium]|nr:hypothetical protein [Anaerolineae bacterium]
MMGLLIVLVGVPGLLLLFIGAGLAAFGSGKPPDKDNRSGSHRRPFFDDDEEDDDDGPTFEPHHVDEFLKDGGRYWQKYPLRSGAISAMLDDMLHGDDCDR